MLILGWIALFVLGAILTVNATVMLISPRVWFKLPTWIRAQGTLSERKNSQGFGALEIRILGALMLAAITWVVYDFLKK
jgi:hypothetical protein